MFRRTGRPHQKPQARNPTVDFALRFDMITEEEYQHILKGNMDLTRDRVLLNLNAQLPYMLSGERTLIKPGRATDIMIDRLLDIPKEEP